MTVAGGTTFDSEGFSLSVTETSSLMDDLVWDSKRLLHLLWKRYGSSVSGRTWLWPRRRVIGGLEVYVCPDDEPWRMKGDFFEEGSVDALEVVVRLIALVEAVRGGLPVDEELLTLRLWGDE